ncbi:MAG TPA: hypothetical protein VKQ36_00365 [Ktedonobacterales bacterium]|nr:hypothetical protein [Ktedonobacterales bacterium]
MNHATPLSAEEQARRQTIMQDALAAYTTHLHTILNMPAHAR